MLEARGPAAPVAPTRVTLQLSAHHYGTTRGTAEVECGPMMGFKSFWSAARIIGGIETIHMVEKGQLGCPGDSAFLRADYFYSLAAA